MRIAQFSDLHYGTKTLVEADRCFGAAIDRAVALGAQVAVISGDATDHALDLHAPAAARLVAQVRRLADHCPVLMLQGTYSHEPPGTLSVFRSVGGRHSIHVADRIQQVALTRRGWVASAAWCFEALPPDAEVLISCLPTVNKAAVAAAIGATDAAQSVGEQLGRLLAGFAPLHRRVRSLGLPTIGVSHGTVFGCLSEHGVPMAGFDHEFTTGALFAAEGVPMAGFDHEFTTGALFAAEAQAFMLGHIHRHQSWAQQGLAGEQLIAYAGSIGRFHYGEEGEKGFLLWEVGAESARCTLEPTPARRTMDIVFEGRPDLDTLREAVARQDIAGASVRVRWTVAEEDRGAVDRKTVAPWTATPSSGSSLGPPRRSWRAASFPWCAHAWQASRAWHGWRTSCVPGHRCPTSIRNRCWRAWRRWRRQLPRTLPPSFWARRQKRVSLPSRCGWWLDVAGRQDYGSTSRSASATALKSPKACANAGVSPP